MEPLPIEIKMAAKLAIEEWHKWTEADGMFPEPEYDNFMRAMYNLEKLVNR